MATETDLFERATIATFYQGIDKGASMEPEKDADLLETLKEEFPSMDKDWYLSLLAQGRAFMHYIGHTEGTKDNTYLFAHYGGKTKTIPTADTTDILDYIWDNLGKEQQKIFGGKKDSWNTSDIYIAKRSEISKIKKYYDILRDEFQKDMDPAIFVGTVNAMMSKLLKQKKLIGISLKKSTKNVDVKVTPTNLELGPNGLEVKSGEIITPLNTRFQIESGRRETDLDFAGNSLRFELQFEAGAYKKRYTWETKAGSKSADVTEPRDRPVNNKGKYVTATARNGSIPGPEMVKLVRHYTGEDLNYNIPLNGKATSAQIKYWQDYYKKVLSMSNAKVPVDIVGPEIDKKKVTPDIFIERMLTMDSGSPSGKNFATKVRAKLRHLRYIMMFLQANKDGKLGELVSHSYFLSSKMNIDQEDLAGPFVKVQ